MSNAACTDAAQLNEKLSVMMECQCERFGVKYRPDESAAANFVRLLDALPKISRRSKSKNLRTINDVRCEPAAGRSCRAKT